MMMLKSVHPAFTEDSLAVSKQSNIPSIPKPFIASTTIISHFKRFPKLRNNKFRSQETVWPIRVHLLGGSTASLPLASL